MVQWPISTVFTHKPKIQTIFKYVDPVVVVVVYNLPSAYTIKGNRQGRRIKNDFFCRNYRFCVTCIREKLVYLDVHRKMRKVLLYERST